MTPAEIARRRRALGVTRQQGRPRRLFPGEADAVWDAWQQNRDLPRAERYLRVAQQCDVPAHAVWQLVQEADAIQQQYAARRQGLATEERERS